MPVLVLPVTTNPRRNMVIMGFVTPALDILPHSSASITRILVCAVATASNSQAATQLSATHVPIASFLQRTSIHAFVKMLLLQTHEMRWSKVTAAGDLPVALIYHAACPVDLRFPRMHIVFGGANSRLPTVDCLHLLDTQHMEWEKLQPPDDRLAVSGQRAGHTLTCVGATGAVLGGINDTEAPSLASGSSSMVMFGGYDRDRRTCHLPAAEGRG